MTTIKSPKTNIHFFNYRSHIRFLFMKIAERADLKIPFECITT